MVNRNVENTQMNVCNTIAFDFVFVHELSTKQHYYDTIQ